MSNFAVDLSWRAIAVQENKVRQNWLKNRRNKVTSFVGYEDCKALDEHWGLFDAVHKHIGLCNCVGMEASIQTLFNCHTHKTIPQYELRLNRNYKAIFLDSNESTVPTIVAYSRTDSQLVIQYGDMVIKQNVHEGAVRYGVVGVDMNKVYLNDCIWDLDEAEPIMKFDINVVHDPSNHSLYHKQLQTVFLSTNQKLYMLDTRSGETMVHDKFQLHAFDLIDEHTIGFVGDDGVGTIDIRMMREEYIHKPLLVTSANVLVNGLSSRALFKSSYDCTTLWDFRERLWERFVHWPGSLVAMNSRLLFMKPKTGALELFDYA